MSVTKKNGHIKPQKHVGFQIEPNSIQQVNDSLRMQIENKSEELLNFQYNKFGQLKTQIDHACQEINALVLEQKEQKDQIIDRKMVLVDALTSV